MTLLEFSAVCNIAYVAIHVGIRCTLYFIYNPHSNVRTDPDESGVEDIEMQGRGRRSNKV